MDILRDDLRGKKVLVLDLETTGFNVNYANILQCAMLEYSDDMSQWKYHNEYFCPQKPVSAEVSQVTGLTTKFLQKESGGLFFDEKFDKIKNILDSADTMVGHNIERYDTQVLKNNARRAGYNLNLAHLEKYDTYSKKKELVPTLTGRGGKLVDIYHKMSPFEESKADEFVQYLLKYHGLPELAAHNALYDITMNALVLYYARQNVRNKKR